MQKDYIKLKNVEYIYRSDFAEETDVKALDNISLEISKGQFVVVIGRNGSGKSTFARLLNALLIPTEGFVYIKGMNTKDNKNLWEIRRTTGMVFQNPDNQIIGTTVEEDTAFGPENIGIPPDEIRKRVDEALKTVGIYEFREHPPHLLSGGQKQRVGIAGILAMKPDCIILDEATAMLDPVGRKEVMKVLEMLNGEGITIIHITHHMEEAVKADRVIVMDNGKIQMDGTPSDVFQNVEAVKKMGLDVPQSIELLYELNKRGFDFPLDVLDFDKVAELVKKAVNG
ncbi:MAG TPA: energy-coupling factor transporter ATPase [Clostridiaceae bacterium]|nr:energy-coupling factor transporter ATPase [Clostridiaceae bacterium]